MNEKLIVRKTARAVNHFLLRLRTLFGSNAM